jgi:hypothetical protein
MACCAIPSSSVGGTASHPGMFDARNEARIPPLGSQTRVKFLWLATSLVLVLTEGS